MKFPLHVYPRSRPLFPLGRYTQSFVCKLVVSYKKFTHCKMIKISLFWNYLGKKSVNRYAKPHICVGLGLM